jgi:hypothetical protein
MFLSQRLFVFLTLVILAAVTVLLFFFNPSDASIFPPCPFHYFTGLYCPGCGSLRAFHQLLHGNIIKALDLNPLMVLMLPVLILLIVLPLIMKKAVTNSFLKINWGWILFSVIVVFWILRNIPFFPFNILAP